MYFEGGPGNMGSIRVQQQNPEEGRTKARGEEKCREVGTNCSYKYNKDLGNKEEHRTTTKDAEKEIQLI